MKQETIDKLNKALELIRDGMPMTKACEKAETHHSTLLDMVRADETFAAEYARATSDRDEIYFDMIAEILNEKPSAAELADPALMNAFTQRKKLKADNVKWILSKMQPKKYGDKIEVDGNMNMKHEFNISDAIGFKKKEE